MLLSDFDVCVDQEPDPETGKPKITIRLNPLGRVRELALEVMSVALLTIAYLKCIEYIDAHFVQWLAILTYGFSIPFLNLVLGFIFNEEPIVVRIIRRLMRKVRHDKA
jgi:hypothetical protein